MIIKTEYEFVNTDQLISFWFVVDYNLRQIQLRGIPANSSIYTLYSVGQYQEDTCGDKLAEEINECLFECKSSWFDACHALENAVGRLRF